MLWLILQDLFVIAALAGAVWGIVRFTRSERWQRALRRFYHDGIGLASLAVIALYFLVGVCDIVKLPVKSENGQPPSLLDIFFRKVPREKNYSAPFAQTT